MNNFLLKHHTDILKYIFIIGIFSVFLYFLELILVNVTRITSPPIFLLLERTTALLLTASIFIRGLYTKDYKEPIFGNLYLFIDLISIVPFWIGFFIPTEYLPIIKAFRVFRLLDLVVHLKPFRLVYFSFHRIRKQLCTLASVWLFVAFISSLMVYETERHTQPEFRDFYNCMYFTYVTSATIGYGDMTAKTTVGRIVTSISSGICLMIFAGIIGVIGTSITHVMGNYHDDDDVKVNFLVDKRIF